MRALVTGGAGFIGSNLADGLLERGEQVTVLDDLSTGRRENLDAALEAGAELVEGDIRDPGCVGPLFERIRPQSGLPPRGPDRRPQVGRRPRLRRLDQRRRHGDPARSGPRCRDVALRLHLHRRGDLRRGRGQAAAAYRGHRGRAALPLRAEQVRRRGLSGAVSAPLRALGGQPAARQRLRAAPGPARRGRRDRDLLRAPAVGRAADRLRRRPADARLHICGRRRLGGSGRRRRRGERVDQRRHRSRDHGPGAGRAAARSQRGEQLRGASSPRPARGEVQRISIDPARAAEALGWAPQTGLEEGLGLTLDSV